MLSGWKNVAKRGDLDIGKGERRLENALKLAEKIQRLRAKTKAQEKEIARLKELNEFLEEASAFLPRAIRSREKGKSEIHSPKDRRNTLTASLLGARQTL